MARHDGVVFALMFLVPMSQSFPSLAVSPFFENPWFWVPPPGTLVHNRAPEFSLAGIASESCTYVESVRTGP